VHDKAHHDDTQPECGDENSTASIEVQRAVTPTNNHQAAKKCLGKLACTAEVLIQLQSRAVADHLAGTGNEDQTSAARREQPLGHHVG